MTDPVSADTPRLRRADDRDPLEVVSYLWVEYQYRHDMVWKLAFRITAVAAFLLVAPFLADKSVQEAVRYGLAGLPILAIVVIAGGLFTLQSELGQLDFIRNAYRAAQDEVLGPYVSVRKLEQRREKRQEPEPRDRPQGDPRSQAPSWKRLSRWFTRTRLGRWVGHLNFARRVRLYFFVLLVAAIIYFVAFVGRWLPNLVTDKPSAATITLTEKALAALSAKCSALSETFDGRLATADLEKEFVSITLSGTDCGEEGTVVSIPRAQVRGVVFTP